MSADVEAFIARWAKSGANERANFQPFVEGLCPLLGVPPPEPATPEPDGPYRFERRVTFHGTTEQGAIDLYKRDCFVMEAKQGVDVSAADPLGAAPRKRARGHGQRGSATWLQAMEAAKAQAERYARALPVDDGWPPFIVVADVGHSFALYADFSRTGKAYLPFPDPLSYRIPLDSLRRPETRETLRAVWEEPLSLDPSRRAAKVTRQVAERLARLARVLEAAGHSPERVAGFLMRCLFTMFAEDVGLLPKDGFKTLLADLREEPAKFRPLAESLWRDMDRGGFSPVLRETLLRFNGGLFESAEAIALDRPQLELLLEAAEADWREVEPAIFGTLLERSLDPVERHKLGAQYTPRAYVERLVMPTVIEPLREEWDGVKAAAAALREKGRAEEARRLARDFHRRLCEIRVLDPACGSGNFLYVTMEHMKRLEGEVLQALLDLGDRQDLLELTGLTVDPHQFLGIELNPRAAAVAEAVLWIGYLQWHFRTRGKTRPAEPVLRNFANIECRDAILAYDAEVIRRDETGRPVTRWDGRTMKKHPVTGEDVPDEAARVEVYDYLNPHPAEWPQTDYIVGNPPFIGTKRMRAALGDGYVEALRATIDGIPDSADYVMYWWDRAATLVAEGQSRRFGLITTNSLTQSFNRRVVERQLSAVHPIGLAFAIPDHPWIDTSEGAAVRISMTVGAQGRLLGRLQTVVREVEEGNEGAQVEFHTKVGLLNADLTVGSNVAAATVVKGNSGISGMGSAMHGAGFILSPEKANLLRSDGIQVIRPYLGGRDLLDVRRERYVIDFSGLSENEAKAANPSAFQHVIDHVKPERDHNRRESIRRLWWRFGWERPLLRKAIIGLDRYIATTETAKHRAFQFVPATVVPDHMIVAVASDDAFLLGALSSRSHVTWALAAGGRLGVGNDPRYNKTRCFETFPFPVATEAQKARIRALGEELDAHRKARQAAHPKLTMTGMYNVLAKLRAGAELTAKEKAIHEQGLVSVLRRIHDELDAAVAEAYGWTADLSDERILERLVALNAERAAEERKGLVRWLRPDYQNPEGRAIRQTEMAVEAAAAAVSRPRWPAGLPEQARALRAALVTHGGAAAAVDLARGFERTQQNRVAELLETLVSLGQARKLTDGRFIA